MALNISLTKADVHAGARWQGLKKKLEQVFWRTR